MVVVSEHDLKPTDKFGYFDPLTAPDWKTAVLGKDAYLTGVRVLFKNDTSMDARGVVRILFAGKKEQWVKDAVSMSANGATVVLDCGSLRSFNVDVPKEMVNNLSGIVDAGQLDAARPVCFYAADIKRKINGLTDADVFVTIVVEWLFSVQA